MENKVVNAEEIHLHSFDIFHWEVSVSDAFAEQPKPVINKQLHSTGGYALNEEENLVGIRIHISISGLGENNEELGVNGEIAIVFHFEVKDLIEHLEYQEEDQELVSDQLLGTLLGIAYSTSRGLVYNHLYGSFLEGTILPVINPMDLLREEE